MMKKKGILKSLLSTVALMSLLIFSYLYTKEQFQFNPLTYPLLTPRGEVKLVDELQKKKLTLLYFGFLTCPDACPTTLSTISSVFKALPSSDLEKINFFFIDLDPERDSIEKLKTYSQFFHPLITPISVPLKHLDSFTRFFDIVFMKVPLKNSAMGYTIDHSTHLLIVDSKGKIISHIEHGTNKNLTLAILKKHLTEVK
ncbi:MAG: SCO family protein [Bacteriovorax sp.]|nr:SCO family protein [Bacteriovorax sp.]